MKDVLEMAIYEVARFFGRFGFQIVVTVHQDNCGHKRDDLGDEIVFVPEDEDKFN